MASRVNVDITARDLTRNELMRMRSNFRRTGQDLDRMVTARTRQNFERLQQSLRGTRQDLNRLRGAIPDDEFFRLDTAVRQAQRRMNRGFGQVGSRALQRVEHDVRDVIDAFHDLDRAGNIDVRIDTSALRRADARLEAWRVRQERNAVRVPVEARVDRNRLQRSLRALGTPFRSAGGFLGGTLSDGIGQGLVGGIQAGGPAFKIAFVAVMTAIITAIGAFLGAALAALLITALGGAFVAVGTFMAAKSKEVKEAWTDTAGEIKKAFEHVGDPLIPSIKKAFDVLSKMAKDFGPILKTALAGAAPSIDDFVNHFQAGLRKLGKNSFDDIMSAFDTFLLTFGPDFENFLAEMGKSFGALARTVKEHSVEMSAALRAVLGVINVLIDVINFFANAWVMAVGAVTKSEGAMLDAWATVVDAVLAGVSAMLGGLAQVEDVIPGMGHRIRDAKREFDLFRESTVNNLRQSADSARMLATVIEQTNKRNILKADISQLDAKIKAAKEHLQTVTDKKVQAKIRADIAQLLAEKKRAQDALNALNGKTVTTYIITKNVVVGGTAGGIAPGGGGFPAGKATGGISRAATGGARNNMTLVGEQGPELVNLAPGSHVRSNSDTRRLFANQSGGSGATQLVFKSSGRRVDDMLIEILREAIHQRGGNPVTVLGG